MEAEGRVVGGHGEQQQELLLGSPVVQRQPIVINHRVRVGQSPVQDPRSLPAVRAEQGEGHEQFAAHHLVGGMLVRPDRSAGLLALISASRSEW